MRLSPLHHIEWIDGAHGNVCVPESLARISPSRLPSCWGTIGLVCTHTHFFFSKPLVVLSFPVKFTQDLVTESHVPSFFPFTLYSTLLVDEILMVDILFFF